MLNLTGNLYYIYKIRKHKWILSDQYSVIQSHTNYTNWAELQLQSQFRIRGLV